MRKISINDLELRFSLDMDKMYFMEDGEYVSYQLIEESGEFNNYINQKIGGLINERIYDVDILEQLIMDLVMSNALEMTSEKLDLLLEIRPDIIAAQYASLPLLVQLMILAIHNDREIKRVSDELVFELVDDNGNINTFYDLIIEERKIMKKRLMESLLTSKIADAFKLKVEEDILDKGKELLTDVERRMNSVTLHMNMATNNYGIFIDSRDVNLGLHSILSGEKNILSNTITGIGEAISQVGGRYKMQGHVTGIEDYSKQIYTGLYGYRVTNENLDVRLALTNMMLQIGTWYSQQSHMPVSLKDIFRGRRLLVSLPPAQLFTIGTKVVLPATDIWLDVQMVQAGLLYM